MSQPTPADVAEAIRTLQAFIEASHVPDEEAMRALLSRRTLESGQFRSHGSQGQAFSLGEPAIEGEAVVIPMTISAAEAPAAPAEPSPEPQTMACVMVREEGRWKFDLAGTMDRLFGGGGMEAAMTEVASAMQQTMEGIGQAMADGFKVAFGEDQAADESGPEPAPHWEPSPVDPIELLALPDLEPLPRTQAAVSAALGEEVLFLADVRGLLRQVASDQRDVMVNWFEDALFANWPALLAAAAERVPVRGRLRAVRIECAEHHSNRFLAIDGSDLVYRIHVNFTEGYYADDELGTILPGVLAGLPESIDPAVAGHRLLPNDDEHPDWSIYLQREVPRLMRRISDLAGRDVRLDAGLEEIYDPATAARLYPRWGLNRILGAVALAALDPDTRVAVEELEAVRLVLGYLAHGKFARYDEDGGVLHVGIKHYDEEQGCFYEHELAKVSHGEQLGQEESAEDADEGTSGDDEAATEADEAEALNAQLFDQAVAGLREAEPAWRQQAEMAVGHEVDLHVGWDLLGGRHERIQPFVDQALAGGLGALCQVSFVPDVKRRLASEVRRVEILPALDGDGPSAELADGTLALRAPLVEGGPPPMAELASAIMRALDFDAGAARAADAWSSPAASHPDPYEAATRFVANLEATLRELDLWPGPAPEPLEVKGAFGCENMQYEQWLAWVLIPRVREIVADRGPFPNASGLAAYGSRALDGVPGSDKLLTLLAEFDRMVESIPR